MWERLLGAAAGSCAAHPWRTVLAALVLAGASACAAGTLLELRTSNLDLVDPDLPAVSRFRHFAERFGTPNMLVVVLEGENRAAVSGAVPRVAAALRRVPGARAVLAGLPYEARSLAALGLERTFASEDGRMAFLFVQPDDASSSAAILAPFVRAARDAVRSCRLERTGVHAGFTGLPQYALDDRDVIQRDISRLSTLALLGVLALFAVGFGTIVRPLLAVATLVLVSIVALGVAALWPGHLTLVSAFFLSALFGLGIDYGIHVIHRLEELLGDGLALEAAVPQAVRSIAAPLVTGCLTTSAAFLTLALSGFRGFAELGVVGGVGIALALAGMTTLLPALLILVPHQGAVRRRVSRGLLHRVQHPALALGLACGAVALLAAGIPRFDSDYLALQPRGSEAVRLERQMVRRSRLSPQFAAFEADGPAKAAAIATRLRALHTVEDVRSACDLAVLDHRAVPLAAERAEFGRGFASADGKYAVYAYPAGDVWERSFQSRFLADVTAVDPAVTGMPVLGRFMVDLSRRALRITALASAVILLATVWIDLRRPSWVALALLPTALATLATLGLMSMAGITFNPLNVMALPVILGTAEDSGVHIVHRFLSEGGDLRRTLDGTGRTVLLCGLTTMVGFGALALTRHRGLASFALTLTFGVGAALVASLLVLPPVLVHVIRRRRP